MNHPLIRKRNPEATIHSVDEYVMMSMNVEMLIVDHTSCNNKSLTAVDLSSFSTLKVFEVSDSSFACCRKSIKDRCFCVENCEKLRELKIGRYSFSDYPVCAFENNKRGEGYNTRNVRRDRERLRHPYRANLKSVIDKLK